MRSRVAIASARCVVVLLLLGLAPAPMQGQEELKSSLRRAVQRLQQGDSIGALLDLEKDCLAEEEEAKT